MTARVARVLVAPDKFKGSLPADEVAWWLAEGLREGAPPGVEVAQCPVADGGDGTVAAALAAGFRRVPVRAHGPTGEPVGTSYAEHAGTAVVELADVCGLNRLPDGRLAALTAGTEGLGEVIRAVLDAGSDRIVLGLGGSASTDGGAGMLRALGVRLLDVDGRDLPAGGAALRTVARVDLSGLHPRVAEVDFVIASDVDNPLCGPLGAAEVYGPQKGATAEQVALLDAALDRWAKLLGGELGRDLAAAPGSGAAGGTGYAALAVLGAGFRRGIDVVLELVDFPAQLADATLVITGEGALDEQTLHGKAPAGVAAAANARGIPVVAVAGRCTLTAQRLAAAGIAAAYALTDIEPDVTRCIADAGPLLSRLAARVATDWFRG